MLYHLIQLIAVDTKTTVSSILWLLMGSQMCDTMQDVGSDIQEFNKRINMHLVTLRARRIEVPIIVTALFEAYQSCEDSTFVSYIGCKEEQHKDNTICWMKKNDVAKMRQAGTAPATGTTVYCPSSLWCTVIYKRCSAVDTTNTLLRANVRLVL